MLEIEERLLDANKILLDINGKIKNAFLEERLQLIDEKDKNMNVKGHEAAERILSKITSKENKKLKNVDS